MTNQEIITQQLLIKSMDLDKDYQLGLKILGEWLMVNRDLIF